MSTFVSSLRTLAIAASIVVTPALSAQRHSPRTSAQSLATNGASEATATAHCSANCNTYSLAVVSAVLPSETQSAASDVVTLVIQNRGGISAPPSMISVAPRNHLSLAHMTVVPALAPGERTTIELPVSTAPDGTQCISITITPSPVPPPAAARFLASAIPDPNVQTSAYAGMRAAGGFGNFADFTDFADFVQYGRFGDGADW